MLKTQYPADHLKKEGLSLKSTELSNEIQYVEQVEEFSQSRRSRRSDIDSESESRFERINVPADGSCLFWSVTLAYLTPVANDDALFRQRYEVLFGNDGTVTQSLDHIRGLVQGSGAANYQDDTFANLVGNVFRNRVVDHISSHESEFRSFVEGESGTSFEDYLENMRKLNAWGGEPEIRATSGMLSATISVSGEVPLPPYGNGDIQIQLFHVGASDKRNHYNFGLEGNIISNNKELAKGLKKVMGKGRPQDFELVELLIREVGSNIASTSTQQENVFESFKARFQSYIDQVPSYLHSVGKKGFFPHFFLGSFSTLIDTEIATKLNIEKIYFSFDSAKTLKVAVIKKGEIKSPEDVADKVKLFVIGESDSISKKFSYGELDKILGNANIVQNNHVRQAIDEGKLGVRLVEITRKKDAKGRIVGISVDVKGSEWDKGTDAKHEFKEIKKGLWNNPESDIAELTNSDEKEVKKSLDKVLKKVSKIHSEHENSLVYADQAREAAHHGFIAGALVNFRYRHNLRVYLEQFAGRGYADIVLVPRGKDRSLNAVPIIIELKAGTAAGTMPENALEQAKDYAKGFQPNTMRVLTVSDNVLCVGLNLDSIESEKFSMHISPREDREIAPPTMQALLKEASDWNGRQDTITNVKKKIKQPLERIYHTFPGTPEKGGNYFSRFMLGQLLLANEFERIHLEKSIFLYNEYPLAPSTRSGAKSTERPVTTFMLTKGNQGQDKEVFIFHIREGGKGEFSEKKIPINLPAVGKITEVCISLQEERKSDFFDIEKVNRYNSLNEYKQGRSFFHGEWKNIPYPAQLKETLDKTLESQYVPQSSSTAPDSDELNRAFGNYKGLLEKIGEGIFPLKTLIEKEAHFQAVLNGAFSHYSDMKLGESTENRALVLIEFQTGRGKRIDMLVHSVKFAAQGRNAEEYTPIGLELKISTENKGAQALLREADNQINKEYKKGVTYKTLTDGDKVFLIGVVFDAKAQSSDSLLKISDKPHVVNVIHSSKVKSNAVELKKPIHRRLFNRGLNALKSFRVHSGGLIADWVDIGRDRLEDSNRSSPDHPSDIFFESDHHDFQNYLDKISEDITALDLSEMNLSDSHINILSKFLSKRKNIDTIDLSYNKLNSLCTSSLINSFIENSRKISFLDLSENDIGSNDLESKAIESLARFIETNNIDNLVVSDIGMSSGDFSKIFQALKKNNSIKNLDCSSNKVVGGFNKDDVGMIVDFLYNSRKLTTLNLANTGINSRVIKGIEKKAQKDYQGKILSIEELDIGNYNTEEKITKEGIKSLAKLLKQASKLKNLRLSANPIGVEGLKELVSALRNTDIKTLDISEISLECNQDNAESIADIMKSLIGELNIKELNFADNKLDAQAIREIFSSMRNRKEKVLRQLNLAGNHVRGELDRETLEAISSGLKDNNVLELLNLANMDLSDTDIKDIVRALKKESIRGLDISVNNIYGDTIEELSGFLEDNSVLRFLNIASYNSEKRSLPEGMESFFQTLKDHNKVLTHLDIGGYILNDKSVSIIAKHLNSNAGIQYLSLASSEFTEDSEQALNVFFKVLKKSNLQFFDIRDIEISDRAVDKIIEFLEAGNALQILHISQGKLSDNQVKRLESVSKISVRVERGSNPTNAGCPRRAVREISSILCMDSRDEEKITNEEKEGLIKELFGIEARDTKIITIDSPQMRIDGGKMNVKFKDNSGNDKELIIDDAANIKSIESYILDKENLEIKLKVSSDKEYAIIEEIKDQSSEYYLKIDDYRIKLDGIFQDGKEVIFDKLHQLSNDKQLLENKKYIEDIGDVQTNQDYNNIVEEIKQNLLAKGVREDTFDRFKSHFDDLGEKVFAGYISNVESSLQEKGIAFDRDKFDSAKIKGAKGGKFFFMMAIYDLLDSISDTATLGRHDNNALKQVFGINGILDAMDDVRTSVSISSNSKVGKLISKVPQPVRQTFVKIISNPIVQSITFATIAYQFGYSIKEIAQGNHHPLNYYWTASSGVKLASMSIRPVSAGVSFTVKSVSTTTKILRGLSAAGKVLGRAAVVTMVADVLITIGVEIHERIEYTKAIAEQVPLLPGGEQAEVFFARVIKFFTGKDVEKEYEDTIRIKGYLTYVKEAAIKLLNDSYDIDAVVQYVIFIEEKYSEVIKNMGAQAICIMPSPYGPGCATQMKWTCDLEKKYKDISFDKINIASSVKGDLSSIDISKILTMTPYTLVMSEGWERFICGIKNSPQCYQEIEEKKVYVVNTDAKHIPHPTKYEYENLGLRIVDAPLTNPIQKSQCSKTINTKHKGDDAFAPCNSGKIYRNCQESFTLSGGPFIFTNPTRKEHSNTKKQTFPRGSVLYISGPKTLTAAANYPAVMHIPEGSNILYVGSKNNETIFIINDYTSGTLEGGPGKENTLVMNVKANNVVANLHGRTIRYGNSNNIRLVNAYNYVSNSDSKQNITTHCETRLINVKNAEVWQNSSNCTDKDYEVRVVNKENVHHRGLKQTIFIVNEDSDNARIISDLGSTEKIKGNIDVIRVQVNNITQWGVSKDTEKDSYSLDLLANDTQSIASSTTIDDFKNLVIQVNCQGITESVTIQDKSLSDTIEDIRYQELKSSGSNISREVIQNSAKKLKAFIQASILDQELLDTYQIAKDIVNNNNFDIPVSQVEVIKNHMGVPSKKVIIASMYSGQVIVDFSYSSSDVTSSYQKYLNSGRGYGYDGYLMLCNYYQDITIEGEKGQHQYIIKLPDTLNSKISSSPIRLNLKIKNKAVPYQSIPYSIIDFAELNVMDVDSISTQEGKRSYINECYNQSISDLTEDSLEIKGVTILDSKGTEWFLSIGLVDYLKSPKHQRIMLQINNQIYKIDSINLKLKHVEMNPNFFRYYQPGEQGLQIYHNQPIDKNDVGLIDFRDKSILDFDMVIADNSLVLLNRNNTLAKVEDWKTYQPAREMKFAFNDTMVSNLRCIGFTCNPKSIIVSFNKKKVSLLKEQVFNATVQNDISKAEDLIKKIGNIDVKNKDKSTLLYVAIQAGRLDIVETLFDRKYFSVKDQNIHSLHLAVQEGKLNIAKFLVNKGADTDSKDSNGRTPLRIAAYNGDLDMVKFFLDKNSSIEVENDDPYKMIKVARSVKKKIISKPGTAPDVKRWAEFFVEKLRYSIKGVAKKELEKSMLNSYKALNIKLANKIYNFDKKLFDELTKEVVNDVYGKVDTKEILTCIGSHNDIGQRISGYVAVFNIMQRNNDLNNSGIFKLSYSIKEIMNSDNYANLDSEKRSDLEKIKGKLPESLRNAIFLSKVCIKNIYQGEYLYAANSYFNYDKNRTRVFTWIPNDELNNKFKWKIQRDGDNFNIVNVELNQYLYAANNYFNYDSNRRSVFTWVPGERVTQGVWKIELSGDKCNIKNVEHNEYLYAADYSKYDQERRSVFSWIPGGKIIQDEWRIEDCELNTGTILNGRIRALPLSNVSVDSYFGEDINSIDENGWTKLHLAAWEGRVDVADSLIKKGANINAENVFGRKPIHVAAESNNTNIIEFFFSKGMSIDDVDRYGRTPLYCASWNGHLSVVQYLIEKGADINAQNKGGETSLDAATDRKHDDVVGYLKRAQLGQGLLIAAKYGDLNEVKGLINQEASLDAKYSNGETVMHFAAYGGNLDIVKYLVVDAKNSLEIKDNSDRVPLHYAAYNGKLDVVKYFIDEKKVDANIKDKDGCTPLYWASWSGHLDVVEYLVNKGADISVKGKDGKTLLDIARNKGHSNIVDYLDEELSKKGGKSVKRNRRHHHGDHNRHQNHLSRKPFAIDQPKIAASSGTRPSSWINDCISWVKSSVGRLLSSKSEGTASSVSQVDGQFAKASISNSSFTGTTLPSDGTDKRQENGGFFRDNVYYVNANLKRMCERQAPVKFKPKDRNTILEMGDHYLSQIDFNGTITLFDLLIRRVTGQKYISTVDKSISPLEAQEYTLNITKEFEKVVEQAGLKSGISMHRLNIDYMGMQKEITKKVMSGKFNEISGILKSYVEKACPGEESGKLSPKKFDKFMLEFNSRLNVVLNQSIEQILHNRDGRLEVDDTKQMSLEPQSYLSNASVHRHSKVSTCLSDVGVTKLGGNLNR